MRKLSLALVLCLAPVPGLGDDAISIDETNRVIALCIAQFQDTLRLYERLTIEHRDVETQTPHLANEIAVRAERKQTVADLMAKIYEAHLALAVVVIDGLIRNKAKLEGVTVSSVFTCD